jgi:hypothetical protein
MHTKFWPENHEGINLGVEGKIILEGVLVK